jgi:hypothetical protein
MGKKGAGMKYKVGETYIWKEGLKDMSADLIFKITSVTKNDITYHYLESDTPFHRTVAQMNHSIAVKLNKLSKLYVGYTSE